MKDKDSETNWICLCLNHMIHAVQKVSPRIVRWIIHPKINEKSIRDRCWKKWCMMIAKWTKIEPKCEPTVIITNANTLNSVQTSKRNKRKTVPAEAGPSLVSPSPPLGAAARGKVQRGGSNGGVRSTLSQPVDASGDIHVYIYIYAYIYIYIYDNSLYIYIYLYICICINK